MATDSNQNASNLLWNIINSTDIGKLQFQWYALITSVKTIDDVYLSVFSWEQLTFENVKIFTSPVSSPPGVYKIFPSVIELLKTSILFRDHK